MAVYKVNISLPPQLVEEIDAAAEDLGLTRSGFVAEASARYVADVRNLSAEERRRKDVERAMAGFRRVRAGLPPDFDFDFVERIREDRERDTPPGSAR